MSKRLMFTLSDEAIALLTDRVPYHSRGAYVSALILADRGRTLDLERGKRCKCGLALPVQLYAEHGIWAASVTDLATYRAGQQPAHDVIAGTGKRVRVGACQPPAAPTAATATANPDAL